MRIINGGKKDYYDYIVGIYGIDEDITYDRKGSYVIRKDDYTMARTYFLKMPILEDKPKTLLRRYEVIDGKGSFISNMVGQKYYFVLEAGHIQYLFCVERYLENNKICIEPSLVSKKHIEKKISSFPLSIIPVDYRGWWNESPSIHRYETQKEIPNPILENTWIPSFIEAEEMYNNIYDYLISIREPKIEDNRSDIQKLESKGFDKKSSFRNPINKRRHETK